MTCKVPDCLRPIENRDTGLCATHGHEQRKAERQSQKDAEKRINAITAKKPKRVDISKRSDKMVDAMKEYMPKRDAFLKGKMCAVYPDKKATDVHHMRGKGFGYFDSWAEERGITKLMDERFWLPVCREAHRKITDNSAWAEQNRYTLKR